MDDEPREPEDGAIEDEAIEMPRPSFLLKLNSPIDLPNDASVQLGNMWNRCIDHPVRHEWFSKWAAKLILHALSTRIVGTKGLPSLTRSRKVQKRSNPHYERINRTADMWAQTMRLFIMEHVSADAVLYLHSGNGGDPIMMYGQSEDQFVRNETELKVSKRGFYSLMNELFNWIKHLDFPRFVEADVWELILIGLTDLIEVLHRGTEQGKTEYFVEQEPPPTGDLRVPSGQHPAHQDDITWEPRLADGNDGNDMADGNDGNDIAASHM